MILTLLCLSRSRPRPTPTPCPYTTLFRSRRYRQRLRARAQEGGGGARRTAVLGARCALKKPRVDKRDRKSTRLNSSHLVISYAVFCMKKTIDAQGIALGMQFSMLSRDGSG